MTERWKPVVGFEELYEVSDLGNVRSVDREGPVEYQHGTVVRKYKGRVLKPWRDTSGYLKVDLYRKGQVPTHYVHRLVLEAFRGTCPPGHEACHWDDDPTNNRLSNLRWGTSSANTLDMVRNGNHNMARKTECKWGHEYTVENTYAHPDGSRECRECRRAQRRAYKARKKREAYRQQHLTGMGTA